MYNALWFHDILWSLLRKKKKTYFPNQTVLLGNDKTIFPIWDSFPEACTPNQKNIKN